MQRGIKQFLLLPAAALVCGSSGTFAKENPALPMPPPMAISQSVSTVPGRPVAITLTLGGRIVEPVEFLIRRPPQRGELGEVRRTGRNTATVVYTPARGAGAGSDSFTFAAQSFDSPVSAAARVRISVNEEPPALTSPPALDFGPVFLGTGASLPLTLKNEGGGVAGGKVEVPAPWAIEGESSYQIAGGGKSVLTVTFVPSEEKNYSEEVRIGQEPRRLVLTGKGIAPIAWPSAGIVVDQAGRQAKGFSLELTNRTSNERTVLLKWPDFVSAPGQVAIPAGGNATVEAALTCDSTLSFNGQVPLRSGGFASSIPLRVDPEPARLEMSPSGVLEVGDVRVGRSAVGRFTVRNTGGTDTKLRVTAAPEITVVPNPANLILSPGMELPFEARIETTKGGKYSGKISVAADSGTPAELTLRSSFPEQPGSANPSGPSAPVAQFLQTAPASPSDEDPPLPPGRVPPVEAVSLLLATPHEIEVAWKVPAPEAKGFRIERRQVAAGDSTDIRYQWVPWSEARIQLRENAAFARFERMPPNGVWQFRIIAVDASGKPLSRSMPFRIFTLPEPAHGVPWWALAILFAGLLVLVIRAVLRRGRKRSEEDDARIARLGKC